ncbi:hypothetical protein [Peribacillus alkalitolerans]|uniref:hypothetical protein n=1 Tax=Peribacillus alkalitolerans TaxID=1550385 RepID=UPI0013D33C6B|nr:hypothetical protein [Peribacillus alkalitolerans]
MDGFYLGSFFIHFTWVAFLSGFLFAFVMLSFLNSEDTMKKWFDESINASMICLFTYKFSIIFFRPSILVDNPKSILFLNGGTLGFQIGLFGALCYLIWRGTKKRDNQFIKTQIIGMATMVFGYYFVLTLLNEISQ